MSGFNMPPGVSPRDIPGNEPKAKRGRRGAAMKTETCPRCLKPTHEIHTCTPTPLVRELEQKIEWMQTALKVIATWARFDADGDGGMYALRPRDVVALIDKTLEAGRE